MNHPSQLNIFKQNETPRQFKIELPKPRIEDFKAWREGDLLDMVELTCQVIQSDEYKANPTGWQDMISDVRLPCSLTTLLINSIGRLESLFQIKMNEERIAIEVREYPNTAHLAKHLGLGGVFTKDIPAIWEGKRPERPIVQETKLDAPQVVKMPTVVESPDESQYATAKITTNQTPSGRQWKIAGQLIAEVVFVDGIGHVGKLYAGSHVTPLKPYKEYGTAAEQCRSYTEGILKFIKTIPK